MISIAGSILIHTGNLPAQVIWIDTSSGARAQTIDGFGTCLYGTQGEQSWWQSLYFDDLQCSILRMDLTPAYRPPYTGVNGTYNSPWYHNNPALPGPQNNNARAYTNAADYTSQFNGWRAPIAVMGPDIDRNATNFDFNHSRSRVAGAVARAGMARTNQIGDFKLIGSFWSPAPWVKVSSGNKTPNLGGTPMPVAGTPWPFVWYDNFAGGQLDTSDTPRNEFDDSTLGGRGPTSALTQFARGAAAYIRAFQRTNNVQFYAISIQNEVNFEEFYNSCTYPLSAGYIAALKAVRAEFDLYPDLAPIRIMGPEDLLGGDIWGLWQYGGGTSTIHKNLQYLKNIGSNSEAAAAASFFCIHGYANDGVSAAGASPTQWDWWANGWATSPTPGIPPNVKGFAAYGKKSWMTETSGENPAWLYPDPAAAYPGDGAWGLALRIHQALTTGRQSAWLYWQLSDGSAVSASSLTDSSRGTNSAKYVAAKHFFRYIRPDSIRVGAITTGTTNLLASAYLHESNATLTIVALNTSANPITVSVRLPDQPSGITAILTFTSSNDNLWQASHLPVTNSLVTASVPGYGITTLYGVAPPALEARLEHSGRLALSWARAALGYELESNSSPGNAAGWTRETIAPVITNGVATVTLEPTASARYYRLELP